MAERMTEQQLDDVLSRLGGDLAYPEPALATRVRARVATPRPGRGWSARVLAPALAAAVLLLVVVALASPDVRALAREIFRIGGIDIFPVPTALPTPSASASPSASIPGQHTTVDGARGMVSFPVLLPVALGAPDDVVVDTAAGERVTLVYVTRPGIPASPVAGVGVVVVELRGAIDQTLFGKAIGPGTTLTPVDVNGANGYWLEGAPHFFFYVDAGGNIRQETLRLADNTLIWTRDGVTYRLEAHVTRAEALAIAASFR